MFWLQSTECCHCGIAKRWLESRTRILSHRIGFNEARLKAYLMYLGDKSLNLINGKLAFRKTPRRVVVDNEKLAMAWVQSQHDPMQYLNKPTISLKAVGDHVKEDGAIPPGFDWIQGEDSFSAKTD